MRAEISHSPLIGLRLPVDFCLGPPANSRSGYQNYIGPGQWEPEGLFRGEHVIVLTGSGMHANYGSGTAMVVVGWGDFT
jgi:hypothetical protein